MEINPDTLEIEITSVEPIDGGVQVFARAWSDGEQIGFGSDGTVDIERFRIMNPPVLVSDAAGDVVIEEYNAEHDKTTVLRFREDAEQAILQAVAATILVKNEVFGSSSIITDKVGNTTTTVYSDTGDGILRSSSTVWSTARDATSSTLQSGLSTGYISSELEGSNYNIYVPFLMFDTSSVPSSDTISSATFSISLNGDNTSGNSQTLAIGNSAQATWNSPASGDFDARGHTGSLGSSGVTHPSGTTSGYLDFTLNATGIGFIARSGETIPGTASATGKTQLTILYSSDTSNSAPTVRCYAQIRMAEQTGTTNDPKLVVEHAAAAATFTPRVMVY